MVVPTIIKEHRGTLRPVDARVSSSSRDCGSQTAKNSIKKTLALNQTS
jgi:hypothetical protein